MPVVHWFPVGLFEPFQTHARAPEGDEISLPGVLGFAEVLDQVDGSIWSRAGDSRYKLLYRDANAMVATNFAFDDLLRKAPNNFAWWFKKVFYQEGDFEWPDGMNGVWFREEYFKMLATFREIVAVINPGTFEDVWNWWHTDLSDVSSAFE